MIKEIFKELKTELNEDSIKREEQLIKRIKTLEEVACGNI